MASPDKNIATYWLHISQLLLHARETDFFGTFSTHTHIRRANWLVGAAISSLYYDHPKAVFFETVLKTSKAGDSRM